MSLRIGGELRPARSGETFPVYAPETGEVLGHVARGGREDVEGAVRSASEAFPVWSELAPGAREKVLLRAADLLDARAQRFVDLVVDESGSTIQKARYEVTYAAALLRAAAGEVRRVYGETLPHDRQEHLSFVLREPLGVVAVISPFNAPLALLAKMAAFPLAAGNAVVAKPSEETPLVALAFAELLDDAGLPRGACNVVTGFGAEVGEALVDHDGVHGIAFTGSTATGVRIAAAAARTMKRLQLELGGKNPILVFEDVDVAEAAALAVQGAFAHAGQICMANSRILVAAPLATRFTEALVAEAERLVIGPLRDERTAYGPLIHARSLAKVEEHVREAVASGARLLTGGSALHGLVYRPTLLGNPRRDSLVWREETFGPVASVVAFANEEEAVRLANDTPYGLSAAVLSRDAQRAFRVVRRVRAGSVHVGTHAFHSNALAPIGGYGMSGIGRSGGKYSISAFTEVKWVGLALGGSHARA